MVPQSLTPPQDITWKRMAYSRDMIDTNFGEINLPPKWRSSLALYYFIVPEEDTADAYPDSRIVYLKLTCSITGWNPSEALKQARKNAESSGALDDLQKSIWETVTSQGWASVYYPCLGAIMQVAVYPHRNDQAGPDDFPYIIDFEPKKRELFESVSEGNEVLSGSAEKFSTTKGSTNTQEISAKVSGGIPIISGSVTASASWQQVNTNVTDTSKENRETLSRTSSFSQMYQLFNGYHLGTNRALFVVAPRPHTASNQAQTDFNLINGERKLEGIQEMFLVVNLPKRLTGFCVQATLDTGHTVQTGSSKALVIMRDNDITLPDEDNPPPPDPTEPDPPASQQLVVTRRIVQNCGLFDQNGNFELTGAGPEKPDFGDHVVWEDLVPAVFMESYQRRLTRVFDADSSYERISLANQMNQMQSRIVKSMISGVSSGNYKPRPFTETKTFIRLTYISTFNQKLSVIDMHRLGYIDKDTAQMLRKNNINTVSELFNYDPKRLFEGNLKNIKADILKKALGKI